RHRVGAEPEECRVSKRNKAGIAAEDIPGETHHRPNRHQGEHQLVVGVGHDQTEADPRHRQARDHEQGRGQAAAGPHDQIRSVARPNRPCGRTMTIRRKITKIAAFCSCVGSTSVESCWTSPMVIPPQNAPRMLPMPPSTSPAYMMMTKSRPM